MGDVILPMFFGTVLERVKNKENQEIRGTLYGFQTLRQKYKAVNFDACKANDQCLWRKSSKATLLAEDAKEDNEIDAWRMWWTICEGWA